MELKNMSPDDTAKWGLCIKSITAVQRLNLEEYHERGMCEKV